MLFVTRQHVASIGNVPVHSVALKPHSEAIKTVFFTTLFKLTNKSNPRQWNFLSIVSSKLGLNNIYPECAFLPAFVISYQNKHDNRFHDRSWFYRREGFRLSLQLMKLIRFNISSADCSCHCHSSFVFTSSLKLLPSYFFPRLTYIELFAQNIWG